MDDDELAFRHRQDEEMEAFFRSMEDRVCRLYKQLREVYRREPALTARLDEPPTLEDRFKELRAERAARRVERAASSFT